MSCQHLCRKSCVFIPNQKKECVEKVVGVRDSAVQNIKAKNSHTLQLKNIKSFIQVCLTSSLCSLSLSLTHTHKFGFVPIQSSPRLKATHTNQIKAVSSFYIYFHSPVQFRVLSPLRFALILCHIYQIWFCLVEFQFPV